MGRTHAVKRVELGWDDGVGANFSPDDLPSAFMHHPVMAVAQEDEIVEVGRTVPYPVHQVVTRGVRGWTVASGPPARLVANAQGAALRRRDHPPRPADVDDLRR